MKKRYFYITIAIALFLAAVRFIIGPPKQIMFQLNELKMMLGFNHFSSTRTDIKPDSLAWIPGKKIPGHYNAGDSTFVPDSASVFKVSDKYDGAYASISKNDTTNNNTGLIDKNGVIIVKPAYSTFRFPVINNLVRVSSGDNTGWINIFSKEVYPPKYDDVWDFSEGFSKVKLNDKFGYVDTTGKEVLSVKYEGAEDFKGGLAAVCIQAQKWGFINKAGKIVVPLVYSYAPSFVKGVATAQKDGVNYKIDMQGHILSKDSIR